MTKIRLFMTVAYSALTHTRRMWCNRRMDIPPVSIALTELRVAHRVFRNEQPVASFEQAASDRGQRASQIVRSIVFRVSADEFLMALVAGPAQISWKALRKYVGKSRVAMGKWPTD